MNGGQRWANQQVGPRSGRKFQVFGWLDTENASLQFPRIERGDLSGMCAPMWAGQLFIFVVLRDVDGGVNQNGEGKRFGQGW